MTTTVRTADHTAKLRESLERELACFFDSKRSAAQAFGAAFAQLWNIASRHIQGGKLLRPLLVLDAFDALTESSNEGTSGGSVPGTTPDNRQAAVTIAAAVEILHYAFLLHDDVIDSDVMRRGRANLIGELAEIGAGRTGRSGAEHWAQTGGILIGDLLLAATHQIFARVDVDASTRIRLFDLLEHTIFETIAGEFADVGLSHGVVESDLSSVLAMTKRKTASYTFELPLRAAVILAGGSPELEESLRSAGNHLGLAYQLQDDLLSTFGDAAVHGKDPYSDLREGKQTAIMSYARMTSVWPSIEVALGDGNLSADTAQQLRRLLVECGAERFVQSLVEEQLAAFYEVLASRGAGAEIPAPLRSVLCEVAIRLEGRQA